MPGSIRENNDDLITFVESENIRTVLDVGVGWGTYENLIGGHVAHLDGIEVWEPYVGQYHLRTRYRRLVIADVREVVERGSALLEPHYDLIIFGDVLEHMSQEEALEVWRWAHGRATWGLISLPMAHYPQGAEHGNPFEVHHDDHLTGHDLLDPESPFGPFRRSQVYDVTGTFMKWLA